MRHAALAALLLAAPARASETALAQLLAAAGARELPAVAAVAGAAQERRAEPRRELPAEFQVREHVISLTDTFSLKAGGERFGTVTEHLVSLTKSFTYTDAAGACVARARQRILSWGSHVDVTDCEGRAVGAVKEQVLKSLFKVHTTYSILDAAGREVAVSQKVDWVSTSVTLRKPDGSVIATLERPWLNLLSDTWTVKLRDRAAVDPRLVVMIAAYKTSVDNDRRAASSE